MRNWRNLTWLIASVFLVLSIIAGSTPAFAQDIVPAESFSPAFTGQGINVEPASGNWNYPDKFRVTNISNKAITINYFLDCWDTSVCQDSKDTVVVVLQAYQSIELGLGRICAKWQLDMTWSGGGHWGGIAEAETNCTTPTSTPTTPPTATSTPLPTATATQVVTPTATATIPVVPTATATQVVTPTATPANTPVPSPTPTTPVTPENTPTSVPSVTPATPEPEVAYCKAGNFRLKPESFTALWPATANPEIVNRTSTTQVGMIDSNGQVVEITPQNEIWKFSFGFNPHLTYSVTVDGIISDNPACQLKAYLAFLPSVAKSERPAPTPEPTPVPTREPEEIRTALVKDDPAFYNLGSALLHEGETLTPLPWANDTNHAPKTVFTGPVNEPIPALTGWGPVDPGNPYSPIGPVTKVYITLDSVKSGATFVTEVIALPENYVNGVEITGKGLIIDADFIRTHGGNVIFTDSLSEATFHFEVRIKKVQFAGETFPEALAFQSTWNSTVLPNGILNDNWVATSSLVASANTLDITCEEVIE